MKKVSVIVPVYNTQKYLRRCFDRLVDQTLEEIEIIAINDGSTDDSLSILEEYQKQYPDKIVIYTKENGGQASARNLGILKCSGEYIGFADSDDYVDVTLYDKMYHAAKQNDSDYVECDFHYLQELEDGMKELKARGDVREYSSRKDMFINPQVSPWNKLYRRELLIENNIRFPENLIYEDTSFFIKSIPFIQKSTYVDEKLVYYLLHGDSTMNSNKSHKVADIFCVLEDMISFYETCNLFNDYKEELEYFCSKIITCSSLSRIGRIPDKKLEKELLKKSFEWLAAKFPEYKKNKYYTGKIGIYVKLLNIYNSKMVARILGKVLKG